jgi:hypothetical protein
MVKSLKLDISYSQLAVFWSSLQQPFNNWTQRHVDQGFAWRPGSVSFRTLVEAGTHSVQVEIDDHAGTISANAMRVIEVPFEVPADGTIEVASISDSSQLMLPVGTYSLRCEFLGADEEGTECVRLVFARSDDQHFAVVRADDELIVEQELLTTAEAATI